LSITDETKINGHKQNSSDESDDDNATNGHEDNQTEQTLNEQVAMAAAAAISGDTNKQIDSNEFDPINRRMKIRKLSSNFLFQIILARPMAERTPNPVMEVVPDDVLQVKIADLGNACWTVSRTQSKPN
jgi:hypothetical protein